MFVSLKKHIEAVLANLINQSKPAVIQIGATSITCSMTNLIVSSDNTNFNTMLKYLTNFDIKFRFALDQLGGKTLSTYGAGDKDKYIQAINAITESVPATFWSDFLQSSITINAVNYSFFDLMYPGMATVVKNFFTTYADMIVATGATRDAATTNWINAQVTAGVWTINELFDTSTEYELTRDAMIASYDIRFSTLESDVNNAMLNFSEFSADLATLQNTTIPDIISTVSLMSGQISSMTTGSMSINLVAKLVKFLICYGVAYIILQNTLLAAAIAVGVYWLIADDNGL